MMMNLTRRQALCMGLIPLAISLVTRKAATVLVLGDGFTREWTRSLDSFRDLFTDLGAARDIGRRYLRSFSQETNRAFLQRTITGGERLQDAKQLRTLLAQKREQDFRTGDIAIVDGWVLSRTEARVCALVALL
jgi:hypothetical protein